MKSFINQKSFKKLLAAFKFFKTVLKDDEIESIQLTLPAETQKLLEKKEKEEKEKKEERFVYNISEPIRTNFSG